MKIIYLIAAAVLAHMSLNAQNKSSGDPKTSTVSMLPDLEKCILKGQEKVLLFVKNLDSNAEEKDVNSIVVVFQKYIDSLPADRSKADAMLAKHYAALRMFFLTTTNKTTVATSFIADGAPFRFCSYNDTATALYVGAIKDGELYDLGKMTEIAIVKSALTNCLLPAMKALDEFRNNEVQYVGLSIYYGCRDARDGAPVNGVTPFCLTLTARLSDIQQYNSGIVTAKGLLEQASLYLSSTGDYGSLRKIRVDMD
jgi:hypothetical protein